LASKGHNARGYLIDIIHHKTQMGHSQPVHRAALRGPGDFWGVIAHDLDSQTVLPDEAGTTLKSRQLCQHIERLSDSHAILEFEMQRLRVKADRAIEIRRADTHMRDCYLHGRDSLTPARGST